MPPLAARHVVRSLLELAAATDAMPHSHRESKKYVMRITCCITVFDFARLCVLSNDLSLMIPLLFTCYVRHYGVGIVFWPWLAQLYHLPLKRSLTGDVLVLVVAQFWAAQRWLSIYLNVIYCLTRYLFVFITRGWMTAGKFILVSVSWWSTCPPCSYISISTYIYTFPIVFLYILRASYIATQILIISEQASFGKESMKLLVYVTTPLQNLTEKEGRKVHVEIKN